MQAFGKLTGICTGYGGTYNHGQQNLQVNAMIALLNSSQQAMDAVNEAQVFYYKATNNRELGFKGFRKISSSVCTLLKSSGANELTLNDARTSTRRICYPVCTRNLWVPKFPTSGSAKNTFH